MKRQFWLLFALILLLPIIPLRLSAAEGVNIYGNGTWGVNINIDNTTNSNFRNRGSVTPYTGQACTWYAVSRAADISGGAYDLSYIPAVSNFASVYASRFGLTTGTEFPTSGKAIAVYSNPNKTPHVLIIEAVNGDDVLVSTGGWHYFGDNRDSNYGYCYLLKYSKSKVLNMPDLGSLTTFIYLDGGSAPTPTQLISDGDYVIASAKDQTYFLDIVGSGAANNNDNVAISGSIPAESVSDFDVWHVTYDSSGNFYKICQKISPSMCLDVQDSSTANGGNVQVYSYGGSDNQKWTISGNGSAFTISPKHAGGKCLDIVNTNHTLPLNSGANVQVWDKDGTSVQNWVFIPYTAQSNTPLISDGNYVIVSLKDPTYYMDIYGTEVGEGTNVQITYAGGDPAGVQNYDAWNITYNSSENYYKICQATNTNMCLDVQDASTADGANVQVWTYGNSSNQKWMITQNTTYGSGYRIMPLHTSSKSADIACWVNGSDGYYFESGTNIQIWGNDGSPVQAWNFIPYTLKDTEAPVISNVTVSDVTSRGYRVTCNVSDNLGVTRVAFPTWTVKTGSDGNQQDDIIWHEGTVSGGTASYYVNTTDHNHESGTYITHIYAYDAAGNYSSAGTSAEVPNPITNVRVSNLTSAGYTVTCDLDPLWGAVDVEFPTWSMNTDADGNPQDDLVWNPGTISDGTVSYTVNISDHNNENGCYYRTHIYASDSYGRTAGGVTQSNYSCLEVYVPGLSPLTISQGNVLGYSGGIEMKTAYDANATGYSIAVYDVANQKTITPTVDQPVKSGSTVTIKIHGDGLVNGNIYKLTVYKYNTANGTTTNSNTVTVYGMPHSAISKVTAHPIGTGVRLDSEFKAGTDGTRYYIYDASTGKQVKKQNLTGPASHLKITGLENNKLYYAYARPYKIYSNQYVLGPKSKLVYFAPVAMPAGVKVAFSDATTAVISTAENATASGVRVLYREVGGSLKNGCVQDGNQCSIVNLSQAKRYEFYVMHYNIINSVRHYGSGVTIQYNPPTLSTLPRPTGIKVNAGNPTWTFTITKDSAAQGISVLYRIGEGNFALACEKDGASCTMDLTKDKSYTFFIMQYKLVNGKKVYSPGATVKNLYGTKSVEEEIPEDAFAVVDEAFDTEQLYTIMEDYLTEEDLNALEAMELAALEGEAGFAEAADIEPYEEEDLYDLVPGALVVMEEEGIPEPTEDDFIYVPAMQSTVSGKAAGLSKLTIAQNAVLGYSNGIEVTTTYDNNATGYSVAVYDVANQKTVKPSIQTTDKSGKTVINISGSTLVNGSIYRLTIFKMSSDGEKSNTVTVYGMPHTVIGSVTAQPIGTGVRLDSVFKTGTDGTRYYVYDASTGKQVKKQNLTGPASQIKITGLENNKLYYAYARPYKIYNNQYLLGPKSKIVYFAPVAMPSGVTVQYSGLTTAVITTKENDTARGVRVLYREVGGSLKNGCVQAGNQCTIANLSQAKSYEFYVMHYNIIDNVRHYGSGITIQTNAPTLSTLARPTGIKIYAGNPTWTFSITKDAAAQGISVLYRINEGNFAPACEKDGASCTMDLTKDKAYTFFIQYKLVDGKKVYSAGATVKNLYGTKTIDGNDLVTEFVETDETIPSDELYDVLEDYLTPNDMTGLEAMDVLSMEEPEAFEADPELDVFEEEDLDDASVPEEFRTMEVMDDYEPTEADFIDVPMEGALTETAPKGPDGEPGNGAEEQTSYDESDEIPGLYFYGIDDSRYPYEPPAPSFQNK